MIGAKYPDMVVCGEIMVFRSKPEYGYGGSSGGCKLPRRFNCRQGLVDAVGGSGGESDLLSGDDCSVGLSAEEIQGRISVVQRRQSLNHRCAPIIRKIEIRGCRERSGIVR